MQVYILTLVTIFFGLIMNVLLFLNERTSFIRQFYTTTSAPYIDRIQKIEAGEEPFVSSFSEDEQGEFYPDWSEAKDSLCVIGYSCVSMLSTVLKLYFQSWENEAIGIVAKDEKRAQINNEYAKYCKETGKSSKNGALQRYKWFFAKHLNINFDACPASFAMLENILLARNRIEHPDSITDLKTYYSDSDLDKLQSPLFIDEANSDLIVGTNEEKKFRIQWFGLHVSKEELFTAILEVERFAEWLDNEIKIVKRMS